MIQRQKAMVHRHILLLALAFVLLPALVNADSWKIWRGYQNYANVIINSWNAQYNNYTSNSLFYYNVGKVGYAYITLPNLYNSQYIIFSAYNSNNIFLGNITGFPYNDGFLLPNATTSAINNTIVSFAKITAFYNPNATISTTCTGQSCTTRQWNYNDYFFSNFSVEYCQNPIEAISIFTTPALSLRTFANESGYGYPCFNKMTSLYAGYSTIEFNPSIPYFLLANNSAQSDFSLEYIPYNFGFYRYIFNSSNGISKLTNINTFSTESLNSVSTSLPNLFIDPNNKAPYQTLYYNLGMYGTSNPAYVANSLNGAIFNDSNTLTHLFGVFGEISPYTLRLSYTNISAAGLLPKISYLLLPAFTINYTITDNALVANVINPPLVNKTQTVCGALPGWYCFKWREQVKGINWTYSITSMAYNGIKKVFNSSVTNYLMLNFSHYAEMGTNCNNIYLRAYDNSTNSDYGALNYSILNCAADKVTLIVPKLTVNSSSYPSFFIYWNNLLNVSGFDTPYVDNNWNFLSGSFLSVPYGTNPFIIQLNRPFVNQTDNINLSQSFGGKISITKVFSYIGICSSNNPGCYQGGTWDIFNDTDIPNYIPNELTYVIFTNGQMLSKNLAFINITSSCGGSPTQCFIGNTTTRFGIIPAGSDPYTYIRLSHTQIARLYRLYTTQYTLNPKIELNPQTIAPQNRTPSTPIPVPSSNKTLNTSKLMPLNTFTFSNYNSIMNSLGLSTLVLWGGFTIPMFYLAFIIIIISIIILAVSTETEGMILGFVLLWLGGILQIELIPVAIIIVLLFLVRRSIEHHKG